MINIRWMVRAGVLVMVAIAAPATAYAAAPSQFENTSVKVSYSDLDIQTEAGAKVLYARLKRASRQACGFEPYKRFGLGELSKAKACYREALDKAVTSIDSDSLRGMHSG